MADAQGAVGTVEDGAAASRPLQIETNGINVITDAERKGHPRDLFWPWFAAVKPRSAFQRSPEGRGSEYGGVYRAELHKRALQWKRTTAYLAPGKACRGMARRRAQCTGIDIKVCFHSFTGTGVYCLS